MKYKKTILPNGFRVVTVPMKGSATATVMLMVATGSNNEAKQESGISHFLEHMVFKGTEKYPTPLDISLEFDRLGAENNAFTSYDFTGYYAKAAKRHMGKMLEMISDIYLHATLPAAELEKERGVILQEISMYEDQPQRVVQEVFGELVYGDTPPGRPVTGPAEVIKKLSREDLAGYRKRHYTPDRTTLVIAGDVDHASIVKEAKKIFGTLPKGKKALKFAVGRAAKYPALLIKERPTDQLHFVLGFRTYSATDKRSTALFILAGILTAGMSSRLFKKLRDELGACYYVRANNNASSAYGDFTISVGVEAARIEEVVRVILDECKKLCDQNVSAEELLKVKEYLTSHLYMSLETTDALSEFYALEEAIKGKAETPEEIAKKIQSVTAKDVKMLAKKIFTNDNLHLAAVGMIKDRKGLQAALSF